jgi:hypothetical protein
MDRLVTTLLTIALGASPLAHGQGLAETARKEKEKRAAKAKEAKPEAPPPKVITQEDLEASRPAEEAKAPEAGAVNPPAASAPSTEAGTAKVFGSAGGGPAGESRSARSPSTTPSHGVADDSDARARQEKAWRERAESARRAVTMAEKAVVAADREAGRIAIMAPPRGNYERWLNAKNNADQQAAAARAALEAAKKNVEEVEEEARRAGVPPGWVR